jgi:shikimate kinase
VLVVVISGPIASGKSTLSRVVARRLQELEGVEGAAIDLDLVYEILDPQRRPKADSVIWSAARRVAGRLAASVLVEGRPVVAEGGFAGEGELNEFVAGLPAGVHPQLVLLDVEFTKAFERASADRTRGVSRNRTFLSRHYREFVSVWDNADVLHLDTGQATVDESADTVMEWLAWRSSLSR